MHTEEQNKIKISISEVASVLGWKYESARAVSRRKSPPERYQKYRECEQKLITAKTNLQKQLKNETL